MTASYNAVWEVLNTVLETAGDEVAEGGDGITVIYDLLVRVVGKIRETPEMTVNDAVVSVKADYDMIDEVQQ